MRVRFFNIDWDTTDDEFPDGQPDADLPTETTLDVDDDCDVAEDGADVLSDKYEYCVYGFDFEVVKNKGKKSRKRPTEKTTPRKGR